MINFPSKYYDNSQIIPEIGMTNADYMNRVVKAAWILWKNFDSEHDNLLLQAAQVSERPF